MNKINLFLVAICLLFQSGLSAQTDASSRVSESLLELSDTAKIVWDKSLSIHPTYAPSFGIFLLQGHYGKTQFTGQIRRVKALTLATQIGVNREWASNLLELSRLEKPGHDLGCKKVGSGVFSCERNGQSPTGDFVKDRLLFNRNHEIIYLRISSKSSPLEVHQVAASFHLEVK